MSKPVIADMKPCYKELTMGRTYLWCSCGRSKKQPLCDGSHQGTSMLPIAYKAREQGEEILFCMCKQTKDGPHCDGAHNNLLSEYGDDDPDSVKNQQIPLVPSGTGPLVALDDGCYVFSPSRCEMQNLGNLRYTSVISRKLGAQYQSMYTIKASKGLSPVLCYEKQDCLLFISKGTGKINIAGERQHITENSGVYIRAGEAFQIESKEALNLYLSFCPGSDELNNVEVKDVSAGAVFDQDFPVRIISVDPEQRQSMADRYFQMLVDKSIGSVLATQFIGHIPVSKAEPHRHLYEEALIILGGEGVMWTQTRKAIVHAGDVIFLPRKVQHSLQSTHPNGMDVVGVIYPGDNPSINY